MEKNSVSSRNLASVGYDHQSQTLEIEFAKGNTYQYFGVPEDIYLGLMSASSKGSFFDQYIKKAGYPYARV